jgi:two-component system LytT family sensor kinase
MAELTVGRAPIEGSGHVVGTRDATDTSLRALPSREGLRRTAEQRPRPSTAVGWTDWHEWGRLWAYGFTAYAILGVLDVLSAGGYAARHNQAFDWYDVTMYRALEQLTCAIFVPPLFFLVRQWPIDRLHWRRSIPIELVGSVLFVMIKYLLFRPLDGIVTHQWPGFWSLFLDSVVAVLLDFWGIIGVAHAVEFYRRAQDRERLAAQLQQRLSQAQLEALKSQLQPHFLFNTLNTITTLLHRDVDAADQMVTDLADLLRTTLHHPGNQEIPLSEEMHLVDRYLSIVRVRFQDRLTVTHDIPIDVREALVPVFLLQPLVENALEHGIAQRPGPGRLDIGATRVGDRLVICVTDDGPGVRREAPAGRGVGLSNIRARLAELYGMAQHVTLEAASPAGGARATVALPFRTTLHGVQGAPSRAADGGVSATTVAAS